MQTPCALLIRVCCLQRFSYTSPIPAAGALEARQQRDDVETPIHTQGGLAE